MTSFRMLGAGLLAFAALVAAGCGEPGKKEGAKKETKKGVVKEEHDVGPHMGPIAEWGEEEYHVEFTFDTRTKTATVYVYGPDHDNLKPAPIKADKITLSMTKPKKFTLDLMPKKQKADPEGTASVFTGTHDDLGKAEKFEGTLTAKVGDKPPYNGDFKVK
jgi:hypothetical protein